MSSAITPLRPLATLSALALLTLPGTALLAQDAAQGETYFETCVGCHGIDTYKANYPTYHVPKLAGQGGQYVVDALTAYRDGNRPHATMHAQASTLTTAQMQAIGAYLQGLNTVEAGEPRGTAPAAAATCGACHGQKGVGTAPNFPTLAGQHEDYLAQALRAYKSGARKNAIMAGFVATLSDEDIDALAAFYAAQDGLETATSAR